MGFDDLETIVIRGDTSALDSRLDDIDINVRASNGQNLLHTAILADQPEMAAELVHRGIDVNVQDYEGKTPLHRALDAGQIDLAKLLIENGARADIEDDYGGEPLLDAVRVAYDDYELAESLLERGADPRNQNKWGVSPIGLAEEIEQHELADLLRNYSDT